MCLRLLYLSRACFCLLSTLLFFFHDTAPTEIYTLSLHDALPISGGGRRSSCAGDGASRHLGARERVHQRSRERGVTPDGQRSEEHTSELQSLRHLVCRLLLEKKKKKKKQ